jgi:hypothetical protein
MKRKFLWIPARFSLPLQEDSAVLSGAAKWHRGGRDYTYTSQHLSLVIKTAIDKKSNSPRRLINSKTRQNTLVGLLWIG